MRPTSGSARASAAALGERREDEVDPGAVDGRPMVAEADVGRREAEACGESPRSHGAGAAFLRQAGQGEGRRQRLAAAMAGDADDVADPLLQHQAQILGGEHLRRAQMGDAAPPRRPSDGRRTAIRGPG